MTEPTISSAKLSRRSLLGSIAAVPAVAFLPSAPLLGATLQRSRPGTPDWPNQQQWAALSDEVGGRLLPGAMPVVRPSAEDLSNPFFVGDQVGLTQSSGWLGAWRSAPSAYAVRAANAADVAAAVRFAAEHNLRLVVKGGGHSYLGGSNAPDSLLVWTRGMDRIELHDAFVPTGTSLRPVKAVSVGAGCLWGRVYRAVCVEAKRYVQGGGCTTVSVAGLVQGGGFGSFSKGFGIAAASLLEAEIVTADGRVRVVNAAREPDLFWALKGGGGGTFGVVTRLTLKTHELPATLGGISFTVEAGSAESFEGLLATFLEFSGRALVNPNWGEQARATRARKLELDMSFQGLSSDEAKAVWRPFLERVGGNSEWKVVKPFQALGAPANFYWDGEFLSKVVPDAVKRNTAPGAREGDYWWAGDGEQVGAFWTGYASRWLPRSLLKGAGVSRLARAWAEASRHREVALHFNKGLAGASSEVLAASRDTAINPQVLDAFALAIIGAAEPAAYRGWNDPETSKGKAAAASVHLADEALLAAAPGAGSYMSECDYFLQDWKRASWGQHWQRLEAIKRRYDPTGLFIVHHGVGSDRWSADGFRPA